MRIIYFNYKYNSGRLEFSINGDSVFINRQIIRSEGQKKMNLKNNTLFIELDKDPMLCNDHLALIFILAFHPILESNEKVSLIFPFPVSKTFLESININWILPNIVIGSEVESKSSSNIYKLKGTTILYGGGLDSLAIRLLMKDFPDVRIVHQINENETYSGDVEYVKTNIRDLYSVYGLPLWVSIMIVGIINKSKYLISGGQLTSSYLLNGLHYKDRTQNLWISKVMNDLGIINYNFPFLSEILNTEIVFKHNQLDNATFCSFLNNKNGKCSKCTKCLRKFLLMACYDSKYLKEIDKFDLSNDIFKTFFSGQSIYFADIFLLCIKKLLPYNNNNVNIINEYLKKYEISDSSFLCRYYKESLDKYDDKIKNYLTQKLLSLNIHPMNKNDINSMLKYKHNKKK